MVDVELVKFLKGLVFKSSVNEALGRQAGRQAGSYVWPVGSMHEIANMYSDVCMAK